MRVGRRGVWVCGWEAGGCERAALARVAPGLARREGTLARLPHACPPPPSPPPLPLPQVCQQEMELAAGAKLTQDLKAALLLVCGVLKQTSFVEADVRRPLCAPWGALLRALSAPPSARVWGARQRRA